MRNGKVIIVGGGVTGMRTAVSLAGQGVRSVIVEREPMLGGKLAGWHLLFPSFTPAADVVRRLSEQLSQAGVEVMCGRRVESISEGRVMLDGGQVMDADAVVICSGFDVFDARIKEEYGYGIYDGVITSQDLERMMSQRQMETVLGRKPQRIAILHCVGSRDEKVGQSHCSKVCCVTGVKQAIELKKLFPQSEVYNFYMDVRMFGPGYEEMYRSAQQDYGVHFLRGRISEVSQTIDSRLQIKAEDTLIGRPLKMSVDMLVLLVGMRSAQSNACFAAGGCVELSANGFLKPKDLFCDNVCGSAKGIFMAGAVSAPKCVGECLNEGDAAARRVVEYLDSRS